MKKFSNLILKNAGITVFLTSLLAVLGTYFSVQLYKNLRTDIRELLPTSARSIVDLAEVTERLESIDNLSLLILSKDVKASKRFVEDLVQKLRELPPDLVAGVEYKIDREIEYFKERQALFISLPDLKRIRDHIRDKIEYEKELRNPLNIFQEVEIPEPYLDLVALRKKYEGKVSSFDHFPGGYYATPDETKRVVIIQLAGKSSGYDGAKRLQHRVQRTVAGLHPDQYASDLEIKYTGGVQDSIEEQDALMADLELSTILVTLIVAAGILACFRAFRATLALVISLLMGTAWTFGVSYFVVGYLNANSAFLGSIVMGNGINFGIIFLARYLEERRNAKSHEQALEISFEFTSTSTWTAALAAGLSYGSLMLTAFRGFNQFGLIGLIGMILCWISAFSALPALLTLFERWKPLVRLDAPQPNAVLARGIAWFVGSFPKWIWLGSVALTCLSVASFSRLGQSVLETDLDKLRNKESVTRGSGYLSKKVNEIFRNNLTPLVILPKNKENSIQIVEAMRKQQAAEGSESRIGSVQSIDDFIPTDQSEKIQVLLEIRKLLPSSLLRQLSPEDQNLASQFLNPAALKPIREESLPPLLLKKFTEKDGSVGKMLLVAPSPHYPLGDGLNLVGFVDAVRGAADSVEAGTAVAGMIAVSSDMIRTISKDGPKATLFALLAVIILVICLFRNVKTITWVLFALCLGMIWLGGVVLGFDLKINFLNFIALPITFGIGVDYGVNVFQRYREVMSEAADPTQVDLVDVIRQTGSAVGLCSFSTIVGYASLLIAGNQGFVSFGLLAVVGELTCVVAALFSLPALLIYRQNKASTTIQGSGVQNISSASRTRYGTISPL